MLILSFNLGTAICTIARCGVTSPMATANYFSLVFPCIFGENWKFIVKNKGISASQNIPAKTTQTPTMPDLEWLLRVSLSWVLLLSPQETFPLSQRQYHH